MNKNLDLSDNEVSMLPLPNGWIHMISSSGMKIYKDINNGIETIEHPLIIQAIYDIKYDNHNNRSYNSNDWELKQVILDDGSSDEFYYNSRLGISKWDHPELRKYLCQCLNKHNFDRSIINYINTDDDVFVHDNDMTDYKDRYDDDVVGYDDDDGYDIGRSDNNNDMKSNDDDNRDDDVDDVQHHHDHDPTKDADDAQHHHDHDPTRDVEIEMMDDNSHPIVDGNYDDDDDYDDDNDDDNDDDDDNDNNNHNNVNNHHINHNNHYNFDDENHDHENEYITVGNDKTGSNHDDDSRDETKQSNGQHSNRDWKGM